MVIWLTGLAGSGKTTVGRALYARWKAIEPATVLIDGDEIRAVLGQDRGPDAYTLDGRRAVARRIADLCAWLDRQDINVVCCTMSLFEDIRDWNRANYRRYFEVYLDAPRDVLAERRHLYSEAEQGLIRNVVGVDIPFTPPANADMMVDSGRGAPPPGRIAEQVLGAALGSRGTAAGG